MALLFSTLLGRGARTNEGISAGSAGSKVSLHPASRRGWMSETPWGYWKPRVGAVLEGLEEEQQPLGLLLGSGIPALPACASP